MIREAQLRDVPDILAMLRESAVEQGFPDAVIVTEMDLARDGFGARPRFFAALAEAEGTPAGLALYFYSYSTWGSRLGLYLEDLYVRPAFRKRGFARALLVHVAKVAVRRECGRVQWVVHSGNGNASRFYESIGAQILADWRLMSLNGDALQRLAASEE